MGTTVNKIGLHSAYWSKNWAINHKECIKHASGLGFDILEVQPVSLYEMTRGQRQDITKYADDCGITLTYCVGFAESQNVASEDASVRKNGIAFGKSMVKLCAELGSDMLVGSLYSYWPMTAFNEIMEDKSPYIDRAVDSVKEIIKVAEDVGVDYCMEPVNRFEQVLMNTSAEGVEFCRRVGSPRAKLLLDTFHINIEEDSFTEAILTAGSLTRHFHVGENNRKAPGTGCLPWKEIAAALKKINYTGAIVMEPLTRMGGEVGRDIRIWRDLSNGADDAELDRIARNSLHFLRDLMS